MSPLQDLLLCLQEAVETTHPNETISIPRNVRNFVLQLSPQPDIWDIDRLVELLDGLHEGYCSRLDVSSFQCILYVLLRGEWGLSQEHGLHLFLNSISHLTGENRITDQSAELPVYRMSKSAVGEKALQLCLTHFTDATGSEIPRRWSGRYLMELIRGSVGNKELFASGPEETRRALGKIVLHGSDHALRFIAADIIREMASAQYDLRIFWPLRSEQKVVATFPPGHLADSRWIETFYTFIQEVDRELRGDMSEDSGQDMHISLSITTGHPSGIANYSSLALVLSNRVTIIHPATSDTASQFLDIMFDDIELCYHEREHDSKINIELLKCERNYVKDGLTMKVDKISLLFEDADRAGKFLGAIERAMPHISRGPFSQDIGRTERHISAACIALAGESSPACTPPIMPPVLHDSTSRRRESTQATRAASSAILSLPSQEEVVARSNVLLDAQGPPRHGPEPNRRSDNNSAAIDDCPELIKSSGVSETQDDPYELEVVANGYNRASLAWDKSTSKVSENNPTIGCRRDICPEDNKVNDEGKVAVSPQVANSDSPMRLQQSEGPGVLPGLPSPIQAPRLTSLQLTVPLRRSATPGNDQSLEVCLPRVDNVDMRCPVKSRASSVIIPDSQENKATSDDVQQGNEMASVDCISPPEIQETANAVDVPIVPAETVSISRLKRPRRKIVGAGLKKEAVGWDHDLRVSDDDENMPDIKRPKTMRGRLPMRSRAKNTTAAKPNKQEKAIPKTPKMETPVTLKQPRIARKRLPTKTLTSSRQRRTAAVKANETIANIKDDDSDNFDVDDPIETTSQEQSSPETPVTRAEAQMEHHPKVEQRETSHLPAFESVGCDDDHGPIIHDSTIGDEAAGVHPSMGRPLSFTTPNETLVLDNPLNDLDFTLLCCADSSPSLQGVGASASMVDKVAEPNDTSPKKNTLRGLSNNVMPTRVQDMTRPEETEATGVGNKQTFAGKLSLALLGTGIVPDDNVEAGVNKIMHIEDLTPMPKDNFSDDTALHRKTEVSQVSQKVAEFMLRKFKPEKLPENANENGFITNPQTQDVENFTLERSGNPTEDLHASSHQTGPRGHQIAETTSTDRGHNLSDVVPPVEEGANFLKASTEINNANATSKTPLVDERMYRKAQIVSFDIDGPRNQCLSSAKKRSTNRGQITPILKQPNKSTASKIKADVLTKARNIPTQKDENTQSTRAAKQQMIEPIAEKPRIYIDEDAGSGHDLLEPELLSQNRLRVSGSQLSIVDDNGSPWPVKRVPQTTKRLRKEAKKDGRNPECGAVCSLMEPKSHNPTGKGDIRIQSFEGQESREKSINLAHPDSTPSQETNNQKRNTDESRHLGSEGARFSFRPYKTPAKTPPQKTRLKDTTDRPKSDIKLSHFIDSLASRPGTRVADKPDVDPDAEIETTNDDTHGLSDYSTDSTPSHSSKTLVQPCLDADIEWQNTLRTTQKTTLDILLDSSKRLVRHLVDEEMAIIDLVTIYRDGCAKLLVQLEEAHDRSLRERERQMQPVRKNLLAVYEGSYGRLKTSREKVQKLPSTEELLSAVRTQKDMVSRLDDSVNGYGNESS